MSSEEEPPPIEQGDDITLGTELGSEGEGGANETEEEKRKRKEAKQAEMMERLPELAKQLYSDGKHITDNRPDCSA